MTTSQTDVESQLISLAAEAFHTFCEDISGMFGAKMKCAPQQPANETVEGLEKRFKDLVAVNTVTTKGALEGSIKKWERPDT